MSEPAGGAGPKRFAARAVLIALMTTLSYAALLIASFGIISLLLDRDVVEGEHSVLVGLVMPIAAVAVLGVACLRVAQLRIVQRRSSPALIPRLPMVPAVCTGVLVWLGAAVAGSLVVWVEDASLTAAIAFCAERLGSPFLITAGVTAVAAVLLCALLIASPDEPGTPARWPWERDED